MTRLLLAAVVVAFAAPATLAQKPAKPEKKPAKAKAAAPHIGHMVYFQLKDGTPANREKLVEACKKYLADHDGVVFYSAGPIAADFKRDVNDRDWDVALHLVFTDKAAHDKYAVHPQHLKFIEENKETWAKVRVFDSELADYKGGGKAGAKAGAAGTAKADETLRKVQEELKQLRDEQEAVRKQLEKQIEEQRSTIRKELERAKEVEKKK